MPFSSCTEQNSHVEDTNTRMHTHARNKQNPLARAREHTPHRRTNSKQTQTGASPIVRILESPCGHNILRQHLHHAVGRVQSEASPPQLANPCSTSTYFPEAAWNQLDMLCWCMVHLSIEEVSSLVLLTAHRRFIVSSFICCERRQVKAHLARRAPTVARRASQVGGLKS